MFTHPGAKLIFQGGEFAQSKEWNFQQSLDWHLLEYEFHTGIQNCIRDLNKLYKNYPALYEKQFDHSGFEWLEWNDSENSVLTYMRKGEKAKETLVVICNFTPVPRENYRIGVPSDIFKSNKQLSEIFNSNASNYGGSGDYLSDAITVFNTSWNGRENSIEVSLAPLAVMVFALK
tara:strand:- start:267 stop:791 length:525 start_codon:yes stop_codon:yes gene_type:complete